MKKILNLLMIIVLVLSSIFSFSACNNNEVIGVYIYLENAESGEKISFMSELHISYNGQEIIFNASVRRKDNDKIVKNAKPSVLRRYVPLTEQLIYEDTLLIEKGEYWVFYEWNTKGEITNYSFAERSEHVYIE